MKTDYKPIKSVADLIGFLKDGEWHDFFINLGGVRSSKAIKLRPSGKSVTVVNEIDDTRQVLHITSLYTRSNIGQAIDDGNFYAY